MHAQGPQTGGEAPWESIVQNGFPGLAKKVEGGSVLARICLTKDAEYAHNFALHGANKRQQGTKDGIVLRLFMSRVLVDLQKGASGACVAIAVVPYVLSF